MIFTGDSPIAFAAWTYWVFASESDIPLITRAVPAQPSAERIMTIIMYICALSKCGARAERIASSKYRLGIAIRNSTNLIAIKSKAPPKYPASPPTRNPSTIVIAIPTKPMLSDTLAPYSSLENTSRPVESAPSRYTRASGWEDSTPNRRVLKGISPKIL